MAEGRSATSFRDLRDVQESSTEQFSNLKVEWGRSLAYMFRRTLNSISNGMWPTSIYNLFVAFTAFHLVLIWRHPSLEFVCAAMWALEARYLFWFTEFPYYVRTTLVSCVAGLVFFFVLMVVRRLVLRAMLSYKGWLFEPPKSQAISTIVWAFFVRCFSGYSPSLYSFQHSLPNLPVPPLHQTLVELVDSLKPFYGPESAEIDELKRKSKEFERTIATRLQKALVLKSWFACNYVTEWWEKYVYLGGRTPLILNSNYYVLDQGFKTPTHRQCARAAMTIHLMMEFRRLVETENLKPLVIRNTIPLCMRQYERLFSTTRIPKRNYDKLVHFSMVETNHIVVKRNGAFYKLHLLNAKGECHSPAELERMFEWILRDEAANPDQNANQPDEKKASEDENNASNRITALTAWDRDSWADCREAHFKEGANRDALNAIESAVLFVTLSDCDSVKFSERGKLGMHGNAVSVWADKSFNMIYLSNGKISINAEHSWGDAPVVGHMGEYIYSMEILNAEKYYGPDGHTIGYEKLESKNTEMSEVRRLSFDFTDSLVRDIQTAYSAACQANANLDLQISEFTNYGKAFVKTARVSPDAYIQTAFQLAYYRMYNRFPLTYESSMTRLYNNGRTETVRSLSQEMADFVLTMVADNVDRGVLYRLLRRACDKHQKLYRNAMSGNGIDRHLFALYIAANALGYNAEYLKSTLMLPWTLSTSQQPQQQAFLVRTDDNEMRDSVSPGGGFGPVSKEGYGVSYMIVGEMRFFFHVSSYFDQPDTSSTKFTEHIFQALDDLKSMLEGSKDKSHQNTLS